MKKNVLFRSKNKNLGNVWQILKLRISYGYCFTWSQGWIIDKL